MDNAVYVFAAYAVIWLLSLGYFFSIAQRQESLRKEIEALRGAIQEERQSQMIHPAVVQASDTEYA